MFKVRKIRTKFLVPILLLQFSALAALGFIGYRFGNDILKKQAENEFRTAIDAVYSRMEAELGNRLAKIQSFVADPIFIKFSSAAHYKSDADVATFNFQKGNGLIPGEPEVGGLVNFPVGLLANEGNRSVVQTGLFPSVEYVGPDGFVKLHVYLGGSNDEDFETRNAAKLDRRGEKWFEPAKGGAVYVGRPQPMKLFLRRYEPVTFDIGEVADERELIPVALPHRVGDAIKGVFIVTTTPDFIRSALAELDSDFPLLVFDREGAVIARHGKFSTGFPDNAGMDILKIPQDSVTDIGEYTLMRKTLPAAGWSILVAGDRNQIYGSVYKLRDNIFVIMLISLSVMGIIVFFIIRKLLAPVVNLTAASDRIAGGELGVVINKESDDEIGRLTESFNQMSLSTKEMHDRLSRMNFVRRQMLSIISHELRTPLTGVAGFYDLLREIVGQNNPEEIAETMSDLGLSIDRCKEMVERLTRASSAMAGELRADEEVRENADLGEVLAATVEGMVRHAMERRISVSCPGSISARLACPPDALKLVLEEALSNAIKYSPDGGTVTVSAQIENGRAKILVEDRGPGIPKEFIEDVMEPFFEVQDAGVHSTSRYAHGGGGLGLGLTLIVNILRGYHGTLAINSREGGGTSLMMTLPVVSSQSGIDNSGT